MEHMKWWGWGEEQIQFDHRDKPALAPFVATAIGLDLTDPPGEVPDFNRLKVPRSRLSNDLREVLDRIVGDDQVVTEDLDRVVHAYGKSLRDLVRVRRGELLRVPDAVVYPKDEQEVLDLVRTCLENDVVIIAFGGGTNISGSLEALPDETRPILSLDLGRLDKVLEIDAESGLARIEAGALGPGLEHQLNKAGWTLGHFPDSFNHSSLGGWIATRSSGMQSDKYGDIAQITKAVRVVSPLGMLATRAVPASSTGPSLNEMILGSEGRLGVIPEATVKVHRLPEKRTILGYFFPSWRDGLLAMTELAASEASPSVRRVSDANETQFSLATRKQGSASSELVSRLMKAYLQKVKHFELSNMCLSFIGFEGSFRHVRRERRLVKRIVAKHGGICVGTGPGALYDQKKFDTPYIRDFLLDRGALADVSETATSWSRLLPLYEGVSSAAGRAFDELGVKGFLMCHLAHSYHSGACLYFTFAFKPTEMTEPLRQYDHVKGAIQQAFVDLGATLSHHHAVGLEHARWLSEDVSRAGASMLDALFEGVDPKGIFNPGKILDSEQL